MLRRSLARFNKSKKPAQRPQVYSERPYIKASRTEYTDKLDALRKPSTRLTVTAAWTVNLPFSGIDEGADLRPKVSLEEWAMEMYDISADDFAQRGLSNPAGSIAKNPDQSRMLEDLEDADTAELTTKLVQDTNAFSRKTLQQ
jgi:hypothetical protein